MDFALFSGGNFTKKQQQKRKKKEKKKKRLYFLSITEKVVLYTEHYAKVFLGWNQY